MDLIDSGDVAGLRAYLKQHPDLTHRHVDFEGGNYFRNPTLLEFVAENPVRHGRVPYQDTKQIPKGLGAQHQADGVLRISPDFAPGLADIEGFSHLIVLWEFDRSSDFELIFTPPTDTRPHGVFATRSPRRPNPIGMTIVELLRRDGADLHVRGVDMLDGTPILDIKPYLSSIPAEQLRRGWLAEAEARQK